MEKEGSLFRVLGLYIEYNEDANVTVGGCSRIKPVS